MDEVALACSDMAMKRPSRWETAEYEFLAELVQVDPRWRDVIFEPERWNIGPNSLVFFRAAIGRGWHIALQDESVLLDRQGLRLEAQLTEWWDGENDRWMADRWHWARVYVTIGPFPDTPGADRVITDFGMHGPFEHVGMRREVDGAFLRIGFRIAQDLEGLLLDLDNIPRALQEIADGLWNRPETDRLEQLIGPFAEAIEAKSKAVHQLELTPKQRARFRESMLDDLKKCSDVIIPNHRPVLVSQAAEMLANEMGIALRSHGWHAQTKFDKKRELFHWEHVTPLAQLRDECLKAHSAQEIVGIVRDRLTVAWITKEEDRRLTELGFKSKRPHAMDAYAAAGIELLRSGSTE